MLEPRPCCLGSSAPPGSESFGPKMGRSQGRLARTLSWVGPGYIANTIQFAANSLESVSRPAGKVGPRIRWILHQTQDPKQPNLRRYFLLIFFSVPWEAKDVLGSLTKLRDEGSRLDSGQGTPQFGKFAANSLQNSFGGVGWPGPHHAEFGLGWREPCRKEGTNATDLLDFRS